MRVAVAIVNYRTPEMVLACLDRHNLERELRPSLMAVVVDNASGDDSVAILSTKLAQPPLARWVRFLPLPLNGGFGWGNNETILSLLASESTPEAILLINPDAMIKPGALAALVRDMTRRPDAGAIDSQLNQDGSLSGSAFRFPTIAREFMRGLGIGGVGRLLDIKSVLIPFGEREPIDWATGASVLIRTQALHDAEASTGVVNGQLVGKRSPPDYIFNSRHRYFALTGGRFNAWLADIAWLTGDLCARVIGLLSLRKGSPDTQAERKALFRIGLGARAQDRAPATTRTSDLPGRPPSWMAG